MSLTALRDGELLDATDCTDEAWAAVYKVAADVRPRCRDCGAPMVAKLSKVRLRFFAHLRRPETCALQGETPEHRDLKLRVAELIRDAGYRAVVEAYPEPGDHGGWRADVLGVAPTGRRVAFEVQLAGMTVAEGQERTARYAEDGIATLWVTSRKAHWLGALPGVRVTVEDAALIADQGLARLGVHRRGMTIWEPAGRVDFAGVVRGALDGRLTTSVASLFTETLGHRETTSSPAVLLVSTRDRARKEQVDERRRREAEEQARRDRHTSALLERQRRLLEVALTDALDDGLRGDKIWLGVPPVWWNWTRPVPFLSATGDATTAHGAPIWAGQNIGKAHLWAVVCPVANRLNPITARAWREGGVRVYVETGQEAERVALALGCWPDDLRLVSRTVSGASD